MALIEKAVDSLDPVARHGVLSLVEDARQAEKARRYKYRIASKQRKALGEEPKVYTKAEMMRELNKCSAALVVAAGGKVTVTREHLAVVADPDMVLRKSRAGEDHVIEVVPKQREEGP